MPTNNVPAAEEVIFALRTQGMSQKAIAARVGCSQSTVSCILKKDFPAPMNNGGRPKKTSPQDDRALKRIAHSNRFKSITNITHLWNRMTMTSPVSRSTTYRRLRFHGFSSRYPALSLSYPANRRKNIYGLHRSIPSGRWRTGSKSSSLMNRNSSWVMATRDLVFGGKSTKGTRRLVWSAPSSIRPPLWSGGMRVIPRSWKFVASCLPRRQSTRRCTLIC